MRHARSDYNRFQDPDGLIPEDEPVFIIRAKDRVSGDAVRAWAALARQAGADPVMTEAVDEFAAEMDQYRYDHCDGGKVPDAPEGSMR
jgi:hypothetical protein